MFGSSDKKKGSVALMVLGEKPKGMGRDGASEEPDDAREGLQSAADDIMKCIAEKDTSGLVDALTSFIRMVKSGDEPDDADAETEE